jgi:hypothetical protein
MKARDLVDELIELSMEATNNIGDAIIQKFELDKSNHVLAERKIFNINAFQKK